MKTQANKKNIILRANIIGAIFLLAFITITGRAAQLQIFQSPWLSEKAASQYERSQTIRGKRGAILDTNLQTLAVSIDTTSVAAFPKQIENPLSEAKSLARVLKLNPKNVSQKLSSAKNFVWIKRQINPKEVQNLQALPIKGVGFIPENSRVYPNKGLAAQVLGFSGIDGSGLEGVEFFYDSYLKGKEIQTTVLKDAKGRGFDVPTQMTEEYQGQQLVLTIDSNIQYITEAA
jgi:cell division protein FtsI (penicillin-binding protein 3)